MVDPPPHSLDPGTLAMLEGLATIHDAVLAVDESALVRWSSSGPALCEDAGGAFEAAAGLPLAHCLARWRPDEATDAWAKALWAPAPESPEDRAQATTGRATVDGRRRRFVVTRFVAETNAEQPLRVLLLDAAPATEHEARIDALERKSQELETALRSVTHDLRSPLVSVLGFARLLREDFAEAVGRTGLHFIDRIEQAGKNMERLLQDWLELSRIAESPHCPVHVSPLPVLEQLAAELKIPLDEAGIELRLPTDPPVVVCDRTRLYQLFSNLIGNAIRHMDREQGGWIEVSIESEPEGWRLVVSDNGPGIAAEDRERIFGAFQTAEHPAGRESSSGGPRAGSSGLGLAIVRKIVEAHGGRVGVDSTPGRGARFQVWLPRIHPD